jgi:large subunit ribosomal protein L30e
MAKKDIDEVKKLLKTDKLVLGTGRTMKQLRIGKLSKVILSSNCPEDVSDDIENYAKLAGTKVARLKMPNDELGVLCKKQFPISVLGIAK